jgi:hypothetical protein
MARFPGHRGHSLAWSPEWPGLDPPITSLSECRCSSACNIAAAVTWAYVHRALPDYLAVSRFTTCGPWRSRVAVGTISRGGAPSDTHRSIARFQPSRSVHSRRACLLRDIADGGLVHWHPSSSSSVGGKSVRQNRRGCRSMGAACGRCWPGHPGQDGAPPHGRSSLPHSGRCQLTGHGARAAQTARV